MTKDKLDQALSIEREIRGLKRNIEDTETKLNSKLDYSAQIEFTDCTNTVVIDKNILCLILNTVLDYDKKQLFICETKFNDL